MKNYIKNMGYMALPLKWIDADKQKHGALSYVILTLVFFLMVGNFSPTEAVLWKDILFALLGIGVSTLVGWIIERVQKTKPNRIYDVKDITIMTKASIALSILYIIIRQINF